MPERDFLNEYLPKVTLVEPEGTYLIWLDFSQYELSDKEINDKMVNGAKVWLDNGKMFGESGKGFQRINIASPKALIVEAMEKIKNEFN